MYTIAGIAIILSYYVIGAYATTDIIRLTGGNDLSVLDSSCYCPICHHRLKLTEQLPIFSYLFHRGRCAYCNSVIPLRELLFEITIFAIPSAIAFVLSFSYTALLVNIILYETFKLVYICIKGKRSQNFGKNLVLSVLTNIPVFLIQAFIYFLITLETHQ